LRRQTLGTYRFFEKIRERLPDLVIENCSSGGHRLEPSMLGRTAMSSFSDAHELPEIPIIAANLHSLVLPRQSQVWAVLHQRDSDRRLLYTLAATFLGRMCLSGEVDQISPLQWEIVRQAIRIKHGTSRRFGTLGPSWRHPKGWQAVRRLSRSQETALVVVHAFAEAPETVEVALPSAKWKLVGQLADSDFAFELIDKGLRINLPADFSGAVLLLKRA
jgi:alpha-galactosidase